MFIYSQLLLLKCRMRLRPWSERVKLILQGCRLMPRDGFDEWYRLSLREAWEHRIARARKLLCERGGIRVAFQVASLSKWKADSLFQLLLQHERFEADIWFVSDSRYSEVERSRCVAFCVRRGYTMVRYRDLNDFPERMRPDMTFFHEASECSASFNKGMTEHLYGFLSYGFGMVVNRFHCDTILNNGAFCLYMACLANMRRLRGLMLNRGINLVHAWRPLADFFLFPPPWKMHY
ncbi:MAG: hypothetical protein ACI4O9_07040 [Akkermansia sp.]